MSENSEKLKSSTFNFTLNAFIQHEINRVSILNLTLFFKIENRLIPTLFFGVVNWTVEL